MLKSIIMAMLPERWFVTEQQVDSFLATGLLVLISFLIGVSLPGTWDRLMADRFQLVHSSQGWVYRMDIRTGETYVTVANRAWEPIEGGGRRR
jgi:hypothetical protein